MESPSHRYSFWCFFKLKLRSLFNGVRNARYSPKSAWACRWRKEEKVRERSRGRYSQVFAVQTQNDKNLTLILCYKSNLWISILLYFFLQNSEGKVNYDSKTDDHNENILQVIVLGSLSSNDPGLFEFNSLPSLCIQPTDLVLMPQGRLLLVLVHSPLKFVLGFSLVIVLISSFVHIYNMKQRFFVVFCTKSSVQPILYKRELYAIKKL